MSENAFFFPTLTRYRIQKENSFLLSSVNHWCIFSFCSQICSCDVRCSDSLVSDLLFSLWKFQLVRFMWSCDLPWWSLLLGLFSPTVLPGLVRKDEYLQFCVVFLNYTPLPFLCRCNAKIAVLRWSLPGWACRGTVPAVSARGRVEGDGHNHLVCSHIPNSASSIGDLTWCLKSNK